MSTGIFRAARDFLIANRTDHAAACAGFRWPELENFNFALDWFDAELASGDSAGRPALTIVGEGAASFTFAELSERSNRVANGLRGLGVRRGDRILLMLGNVAALWETMLAAMKLGAVVSPTATLLTPGDLAERIARGRIRHVIAAAEDTAKFATLEPEVTRIAVGTDVAGWHSYDALLSAPSAFAPEGLTKASDPMLLYFTSGTTAKPKLVLHSHVSYPVGHMTTAYWLGLLPGDVHLNISSPGWAKHAYSCVFAPWIAGATVFVANLGRFSAKPLLDAIRDNQVTTICAPPTVWRMFVQEDLAAWKTSLREICSAGEPLNPEVIEQVQAAWGLVTRDGYGQTETTVQIGNPPGLPVKYGSMGLAMPGYDMHLLDTDDREATEGEVSISLHPRPTGLMMGYQNDDGTTTKLSGQAYRTGDVASRDADGYLTYVGRADDVFKASDYRISPFELESVLIEHPAVAEAAVVPAPDPTRLAVPKAYVTLAQGFPADRATALSIFQHLKTSVAPFRRVRRIEFSELPKTISGKIRRVELRQTELTLFQQGERAAGEFREEDFPELKT